MSDLELKTGGVAHYGWKSIDVQDSMEHLARRFRVTASERWSSKDEPVPFDEGDACELWHGSEQVLNGHIDEVEVSYDPGQHGVSVTGRSLGDLIDCSAQHKGGQFRNVTLTEIAAALCDPFGITVVANTDVGNRFRKFEIQFGESVHECLERAARSRGVLLGSSGSGQLVIDRAATQRIATELRFGVNVQRCRRRGSMRERFSEYVVKSQMSGGDELFGSAASQIVASAADDQVTRHRPKLILAEAQLDKKGAQDRANWERAVRFGRSRRLTYVTPGWTHADGLWASNTLVRVVDEVARIDDDLIIASVRLVRDNQGSRTELEVTRPEAFQILSPPPEPRKDSFF